MTLPRHYYPGLTRDTSLFWMVFVSVGAHVAFLTGAFVLPELNAQKRMFTPAYTVELVSLPANPPPGEMTTNPSVSDAATEDLTKKTVNLPSTAPRIAEPQVKEEVPEAPIVKKRQSFKIKVNKASTEKRISKQLERIKDQIETRKATAEAQKKIEEEAERELARELERLVAKEKAEAEAKASSEQAQAQAQAQVQSGAQGTGIGGSQLGLKLQIYKTRVWNKVRGNWSYPEILASQSNLEAVVLVSVTNEGQIRYYKLLKKSGNGQFDQSVIRAVKLSEPFPRFPEGYVKRYEELELRFSLAELTGIS